ncbi:MAG: hypothetical protein MZU84_03320 [Sphingobacterium sp.]|nr:hypothetical protein [Sphingobacterium sp.]
MITIDTTITQSIQQAVAIIRQGRALERMLIEAGFTLADVDGDHKKPSIGEASEQNEANLPTTPEPAPKEPEWPKANDDGELIDVRGIAWDERIHASSRACNEDGTWRRRRGVDPKLVECLENEAREAAIKAQNAELPLNDGPTTTDPHPTEDCGNADQPDDTKPLTYEQIREGMATAQTEDELNDWAEESRHVVITQSQRATLDLVYEQRARQLTAPAQNAA